MDARRVVENLLDDPKDFVMDSPHWVVLRGNHIDSYFYVRRADGDERFGEQFQRVKQGHRKGLITKVSTSGDEGISISNLSGGNWEIVPYEEVKALRLDDLIANGEAWREPTTESIAVDLDGTLAKDTGWKGMDHIGEPVPEMLELVQKLLDDGEEVVIFTARAHDGKKSTEKYIRDWLKKHDLPNLEITNEKRPDMEKFYDDKAVEVAKNKGVSEGFIDKLLGYQKPDNLQAEVDKIVAAVKPFHVSQAIHSVAERTGKDFGADPTDTSFAVTFIQKNQPYLVAVEDMESRVRREGDREAILTAVFSALRQKVDEFDGAPGEEHEPFDVGRMAQTNRKANSIFRRRRRHPGLEKWLKGVKPPPE